MKRFLKITSTVGFLILAVVVYHYCLPKYTQRNEEARDMPIKVWPFRDSTYVYIPYKITLHNNRLSKLKFDIYDGKGNGSGFGSKLIYNTYGLELRSYWNKGKNTMQFKFLDRYGDIMGFLLWRQITKDRNGISPFLSRDFYYYKRFTLSNKNDRFKLKHFVYDTISKQLATLDYKLTTTIPLRLIDSLYKTSDNKRFNVNLGTSSLERKMIRARINRSEQELVYTNYYDSMRGMNKKERKAYISKNRYKIAGKHPKDDF